MLNIVLLCTLWVCIWALFTKQRECIKLIDELDVAYDKVDELEDVIIDLKEDISILEDEIFDLKEYPQE